MPTSSLSMKTFDLRALAQADLAIIETEPGKFRVAKNRTGPIEEGVDWLRRQVLIDAMHDTERLLEKRIPMPLDDLSGCRVATDENEARKAYPHVCWEHPQLYPGIMVPNWAIALRDACTQRGLAGFGRELLKHAKRLFPPPDREPDRQEKLQQAYEDGDDVQALEARFAEQDKEDLAKEQAGLQAIKAAIAVLDSAPENLDQNAREALAMKVVDVLEAGGLKFNRQGARGPYRKDVPKERREVVNEQGERETARAELLTATRIPGRDVPRARFRRPSGVHRQRGTS